MCYVQMELETAASGFQTMALTGREAGLAAHEEILQEHCVG